MCPPGRASATETRPDGTRDCSRGPSSPLELGVHGLDVRERVRRLLANTSARHGLTHGARHGLDIRSNTTADGRHLMSLAILIVALAVPLSEHVDLRTVMASVGAYVAKYQQDFSLLLADERYVQEVTNAHGGRAGDATRTPGGEGSETERRVLVSEFALVRVKDGDRTLWLAFRDVVDVDGQPVRDRHERLQRLFLTPSLNALAQARGIALESARYNIGDLVRTVNVPTLALEFLETAAQKRSRFATAAEEMVGGVRAWVVSFEERARPALIRTPGGRDVRTKGLAWIDPGAGRILKTRIDPQLQRGLTARITTTYAPDERLDLWVPVEMTEVYETESRRITGEATYTNFRRFETDVRLLGIR